MYKAAILVLSDKGARGEREDLSGPAIEACLDKGKFQVIYRKILPDDQETIEAELLYICDQLAPDLLLTTGGTGFSRRDVTPEATRAVAQRLAPGIAEAIRWFGMQKTPKAMLSRAVSAIRGDTLIINLPGSVRGVRESLEIALPVLDHALDILRGDAVECGRIDQAASVDRRHKRGEG